MLFNKKKYFELLELEKKYENQGKSLFEDDSDNYIKLLDYQVELQTHIYWQNRKEYVSIIKSCLNDVISADDFKYDFFALWREHGDALDTIEINFEPNPKSIGFDDIIEEIFSICEIFEPEANENQEYNATWLKNSLKKIFLEMQKYLD